MLRQGQQKVVVTGQVKLCYGRLANIHFICRLATEARHVSFSPFFVSVDGALGKEAALFLGRITDRLFVTWGI